MNIKKRDVLLVAITFCLIVLLVYFLFFFSYSCNSVNCFYGHLEDCNRVEYIRASEDTVWKYSVIGKKENKCVVETELVKILEGTKDKKVLEGKSMKCYLPLNVREIPEKDLSRCHGNLKEEIQELFIKNLHGQIRENLGKINQNIGDIV